MEEYLMFPELPSFTDDILLEAKSTGDYRPILFEWYKYIGIITNIVASIQSSSESFRTMNKVHYAVLIGLLNRCSRLILSNIALSHNGLYGETFQILERCIFESSTKLIWLCIQDNDDSFNRFLSDGLKSDIELLDFINKNINERNGEVQVIEQRMISSINDVVIKSGLSIEDIRACKKLPTLSDMLKDINKEKYRLSYIVDQKMGSHSTHGTWTNLIKYYLVFENDEYKLRDHNVEIQQIQFISSLHVINALIAFVNYVFTDKEIIKNITGIFIEIQKEILDIYNNTRKSDFYKAQDE